MGAMIKGKEKRGNSDPVKKVINPYAGTLDGPQKKYDLSSTFYHLIMGVWEIKPNLEALKMAEMHKGERVLDIAFGTGWCLQRIIPLVKPPVFGVDFSEGMCNICCRNLTNAGLRDQAVMICSDASSMPFEDHRFDVVFSTFLLDLLPQDGIPKVLAEMQRVLAPHGRMVAMTMTKQGAGLLRVARHLYEWLYDYWPVVGGYRVSSRPIYLDQQVTRAGFTITKSKLTHIPLLFLPVRIVVATPNLL